MKAFKDSYSLIETKNGIKTDFEIPWSGYGEISCLDVHHIKNSKLEIDKIVENFQGEFDMGFERAFLFVKPDVSKAIYVGEYERDVPTKDIKEFVDQWVEKIEEWERKNC